jgi:hypothetical protein
MSTLSDSLLDELLRVATIDDVLRLAGHEVPDDENKPLYCPLHAERSPSFFRQRSGMGYRCQGCAAHGGVLDLVVALELAPTKSKAVDFLATHYRIAKGLHRGTRSSRSARPIARFQIKPAAPITTLTAEEGEELCSALRGGRPLIGSPGEEYLRGRGVDPVFAAEMRVGFHPAWMGRGSAVIFLGFDGIGNLACAQGRFLYPTDSVKTMSRGKISLGVFSTPLALKKGLNGDSGPVAITEAPLDAIALAMKGLPSIALFGAGNRQAWLVDSLAGRNVVIATDEDAAGNKAEKDLRDWLRRRTHKTRMRFYEYKDAAEMLERFPEKLALRVEEAIQSADPLRLAMVTALKIVRNGP